MEFKIVQEGGIRVVLSPLNTLQSCKELPLFLEEISKDLSIPGGDDRLEVGGGLSKVSISKEGTFNHVWKIWVRIPDGFHSKWFRGNDMVF